MYIYIFIDYFSRVAVMRSNFSGRKDRGGTFDLDRIAVIAWNAVEFDRSLLRSVELDRPVIEYIKILTVLTSPSNSLVDLENFNSLVKLLRTLGICKVAFEKDLKTIFGRRKWLSPCMQWSKQIRWYTLKTNIEH